MPMPMPPMMQSMQQQPPMQQPMPPPATPPTGMPVLLSPEFFAAAAQQQRAGGTLAELEAHQARAAADAAAEATAKVRCLSSARPHAYDASMHQVAFGPRLAGRRDKGNDHWSLPCSTAMTKLRIVTIAHAAVSRRPSEFLLRSVARTEGYTYAAKVWACFFVQAFLCRQTLLVRFVTLSLSCKARCDKGYGH
jgi:hypothetical protein